jgi:hypothetical protein
MSPKDSKYTVDFGLLVNEALKHLIKISHGLPVAIRIAWIQIYCLKENCS